MLENKYGVMCIAELPLAIFSDASWFVCRSGLVAIFWFPLHCDMICILMHMGRDFVAVKYSPVYIVSVYISPNKDTGYFLTSLDELRDFYLAIEGPVILCGDFNARSPLWGDFKCNYRGDILEEWSAELDLRLCNDGEQFTCVRLQGSSIVDLT